jgi:predicted AAA+ superfamily ATPase
MKDKIKRMILEWQEKKHDTIYIYSRKYRCEFSEEINTVIGLRRIGKTYFIFYKLCIDFNSVEISLDISIVSETFFLRK